MGYLRAILLRTAWMVLFWFDQPMPPHQMPSTKQAMHRGTKTYLPKGMNHFMMGKNFMMRSVLRYRLKPMVKITRGPQIRNNADILWSP